MRVYDSLIFGSHRYSRLQKARLIIISILELSALVVIGLSAASVNLAKEDDIDIFNAFDFGSKGNARQVALLALYVSCFTELLLVFCRFVFNFSLTLFTYKKFAIRIDVTPVLINGICLNILWGLWLAVGARSASLNHLVASCSAFEGTTFTVCALFRAYQAFAWICFALSFALAMSTPAFYRKLWPEVYLDQPAYVEEHKENVMPRPRRRATQIVEDVPVVEKETPVKRLRKSRLASGRAKAAIFRKSPPTFESAPPTVEVEKQVVDDEGAVLPEEPTHDDPVPVEEPKHEQATHERGKLHLTHDIPSGDLDLNTTRAAEPSGKDESAEPVEKL